METTFMTIHNLTPNANILFASESVSEILGYLPYEVTGKSCFDYFHPEEVPFARHVHDRGIQLDKAAVLHYARIKAKDGQWVGCECVFTIVYDVLVACTSIYRRDPKSEKRAADTPVVRRLFASSPRDPRYHMLEHLSAKFKAPALQTVREPRAALILNRFSRTLTIMYATNSISDILGVSPETLREKSFYECIKEQCLPGAIRSLESAKANDSIAYLRFWYRDARRQEDLEEMEREASHSSSDGDEEDGGVRLSSRMEVDSYDAPGVPNSSTDASTDASTSYQSDSSQRIRDSRTSSGVSVDLRQDITSTTSDRPSNEQSSTSSSRSFSRGEGTAGDRQDAQPSATPAQDIEIEAVVSCTSDGLVVVLRRARPQIPSLAQQTSAPPQYGDGLFAAPWGAEPISPLYIPEVNQAHQTMPMQGVQAQSTVRATGGPSTDSFMNSIREVAVFAWSLTGINGNIAAYGHGTPTGEAVPPAGFPIWDPQARGVSDLGPENQAHQSWTRLYQNSGEYGLYREESFRYTHEQQQIGRQQGFSLGRAAPDYLRRYVGDGAHGAHLSQQNQQDHQDDWKGSNARP
ncbi:MAG: hypothetical protein M1818_006230 [Claussenomyces sp. TS43310]|nr:MAG: hypothetical protein M1818_006230 [Claussenomyces sp. TS43310]